MGTGQGNEKTFRSALKDTPGMPPFTLTKGIVEGATMLPSGLDGPRNRATGEPLPRAKAQPSTMVSGLTKTDRPRISS